MKAMDAADLALAGKLPPDPFAGATELGDVDARCAALPCDDIGNGQRLALRFGDDLRYCFPWRKWLFYSEGRWRLDDVGFAEARAKQAARGIDREVALTGNEARRVELRKHAAKSCSMDKVRAMLAAAASEPDVAIRPEQLDGDPFALNVANGTIDLRTGALRPHRREDLLTKLAPVEYDGAAWCPTLSAFLQRIMGADESLIAFMQRAAGYTLTGDVGAQAFFFLHGGGANGKTTLLTLLRRMLGDYAVTISSEVLLEKRGAEPHPTEKMALKGARLAICEEMKSGRRFDLGTVKQLTGGGVIKARRMREDDTAFEPTHKLFLAANSKPRLPEADEATRRRVLLVPFEVTIPESERDPGLADKLAAELPGVLAWAVQGCLEWQRLGAGLKGLAAPDRVREATSTYLEQEDLVGNFLESGACDRRQGAKVQLPLLFAAFREWCEQNKEIPLGKNEFNGRIEQLPGVKRKKSNGQALWTGIGLSGAPVQQDLRGVQACA